MKSNPKEAQALEYHPKAILYWRVPLASWILRP